MQNHYNYVFDNITNTYNFVTKNRLLYRVAFVKDETLSTIAAEEIPNIFQIVVDKANSDNEFFDSKVSRTIIDIVEKFFRVAENSLIFICSDEGTKGKKRHQTFSRWYKNSPYKEEILKLDNVIHLTLENNIDQYVYTSFLVRRDNPNKEKLIKIYLQIEEVLNDSNKSE